MPLNIFNRSGNTFKDPSSYSHPATAAHTAALEKLEKTLSLFVMPDIDTIKHLTKDPDAEDYAGIAINKARMILETL